MIRTGCYKDWNSKKYNTYSISKDKGKDANYEGKCYLDLAPKPEFFHTWRANRGNIDDLDNNKYYIEQFYLQVLSKLDAEKVYNELDNSILLCYEDENEFCHRHIVAAWFKLLLDKDVLECKPINNSFKYYEVNSFYIEYLKYIIKKYENEKFYNNQKNIK